MPGTTRRLVLASTLLAMALAHADAPTGGEDPPPIPDTPVGRSFGAFLQAYNAGSAEALGEFVARHYDPTIAGVPGAGRQLSGYWLDIYREYGPVRLHSLTKSEDKTIEGWFRGEVTQFWVGFGFELSPEAPHGVAKGWRIHGSRPKEAAASYQPRSAEEVGRYLESYLPKLAKANLFSGAILVAKDGKPLFQGAYGLADQERNVANRLETKFNIASLTKMFTGIAIAQLAARGKVRWDDPLRKYLPEYPEPIAAQVTLRHLLTHTSGIELDGVAEYNDAVKGAKSIEDLVKAQLRYLEKLPNDEDFKPLDHFDYSNEGYDLLGAVVERVTGKPYFDYLGEQVFKVSGMSATGVLEREQPMPDLALGYTARHPKYPIYLPEPRQPNTAFLDARSRPSGSCYSTVPDLFRFAEALRRHKLLGRKMTALVTSTQIETTKGDATGGYGFGFWILNEKESFRFGHSGGIHGGSARFDVYPRLGYTVIVLSNAEGSAGHLADHVRDLIAP